MTLPVRILHCPELGRDISALQAAIPHAEVAIGLRLTDGHAGCNAGHQAIVRQAQAEGWPAVCVLEDDCRLTPSFVWSQWLADVAWAAQHGFTMLVGGSVSMRNPRLVRTGLFSVERCKSTHCVVYLSGAYDAVARVQAGPIDKQLGWLGVRAVVTYPFVAVQAPGYSGTLNQLVDYVPMYQAREAALGAMA